MTTATMPDVDQGEEPAAEPAEEQPAATQAVPDDEPGAQSPADVDTEADSAEIELRGTGGALTLLPGQRDLDGRQTAALAAIGIDTKKDPDAGVHVRPFIHMCQVRGLDPFAKEAYLIGRGKQGSKKWTMQVGIDGYLKIAGSTGRYIGIRKILWMGNEDDPNSYMLVNGVMEPVWWAKWPASKGQPGAAKAIIAYYDEAGIEREQEAVADWAMYAPYDEEWEDGPKGRRKKIVDGKPVQKLRDIWERGGAHMLGKCAMALGLRRAFPAKMSGMYLHEEMHRADAFERQRQEAEATAARIAYVQSQRAAKAPANADGPIAPADSVESVLAAPSFPDSPDIIEGEIAEPGSGPMSLGDVMARAAQAPVPPTGVKPDAEPEPRPEGDEETQRGWLLAELAMMAEVVGSTPRALATRWVARAKKNVEDFTRDELLSMVAALRPMVVGKMLESTDTAVRLQADVYRQADATVAAPVEWLLGLDLAAGE